MADYKVTYKRYSGGSWHNIYFETPVSVIAATGTRNSSSALFGDGTWKGVVLLSGDQTIKGVKTFQTNLLKLYSEGQNGDMTVRLGDRDSTYGFELEYLGSGSGNNNDLILKADDQNGPSKEVFRIKQDAKLDFKTSPTINGVNVATESWVTSNTRPAGNVPWGEVSGKPSFATVATSGSYADLSNKPTIPSIPSVLDTTEGNTGTATTQRTINAANLKAIILNHSPAGSRPASDVQSWAKSSQTSTSNRFLTVNNNTASWRTQEQMRSDLGLGSMAQQDVTNYLPKHNPEFTGGLSTYGFKLYDGQEMHGEFILSHENYQKLMYYGGTNEGLYYINHNNQGAVASNRLVSKGDVETMIGDIEGGLTQLYSGSPIAIPTTTTANANNITLNQSINLYNKRVLIEVRTVATSTAYETHTVIARLGSNTTTGVSNTYDRLYSWTVFDGQYLKIHSFKAYTLNVTTDKITINSLKHLVGSFSGSTINWTTPTVTTYLVGIWLME